MNGLMHCIYASAAVHDFTSAELTQLLESSQEANRRLGITGILLYVEGNFFQVLEGKPSDVNPLYERIARDDRHTRVTKIISETVRRRAFGEWSMAFLSLSQQQLSEVLGAKDFSDRSQSLQPILNGRSRKLLEAFCDGCWRTRVPASRQLLAIPA